MTNRLIKLFENKPKNLLSVYYTAGYPDLNNTLEIARKLERAGVAFLEIGFPFSDPIADGPVIQKSNEKAIHNGMNLQVLFEQIKHLRKEVQLPVILMGDINPVLQYGVEAFCKTCEQVGIDGLIIPDLPLNEYENLYAPLFKNYQLSNIFLVTPQTDEARIRKIDAMSSAFIYLLSSSSITGGSLDVSVGIEDYYKRIKAMQLKNPTIIGFGISKKANFDKACEYANGAIVGSAFVKLLSGDDYLNKIPAFIKSIRE